MKHISMSATVLCALSISHSIYADVAEDKNYQLIEAVSQGEVSFRSRLRYEDANQGLQGAQALTLGSKLTYASQAYQNFFVLLEVNDVTALPDDENYNSGLNNQSDDVLVLDPEGTEVNQAWLAYDASNTLFKYGRQSISLNNERLIGGDSWRQNPQTFAGLTIKNENLNLTRFYLGQLNSVQSVLGSDHDSSANALDAKFMNLEYRGFWSSKLSVYGLWLNEYASQPNSETKTYGVRFAGELGDSEFSLDYDFSYSNQEDAGSNPLNYSANYSMFELDFGVDEVHMTVGQEVLGGSKDGYFVTPLASLHEFQGWTEQFRNQGLGNISGGIQDRYINVKHQCSEKYSIAAVYHVYASDNDATGAGDLGSEWGVEVNAEYENYGFNLKYADYNRDQFGIDTKRLWLSSEFRF